MDRLIKEERGLTLLELMFASGVLAMTLSLLFGSMMSVSLANDATEGRAVAVTQVSSVMEELRATSSDELLSYVPPQFEGLGTAEMVEVRCYNAGGETLSFPVSTENLTAPLPNPLQVECIVRWYDERGRHYSYNVSEWIYR
ncbi:MAG: hypothetical protein GWP08_12820 [Nitrospiraceae bacterium]|nr:hypothetical protein [Nitrospiraceae bacterium]